MRSAAVLARFVAAISEQEINKPSPHLNPELETVPATYDRCKAGCRCAAKCEVIFVRTLSIRKSSVFLLQT